MLLPLSLFSLLLFDILGFITARASPLMVNTRELGSRYASSTKIPIRIAAKDARGNNFRDLRGKQPPGSFQSDDNLIFVFGTLVAFQVSHDEKTSELSVKDVDLPRNKRPPQSIDHRYFMKLGQPELVATFNEAIIKQLVVERFTNIDQLLLETKKALEHLGKGRAASDLVIEDELDYFSLMMISMQLEYGKEGNPVLPDLKRDAYSQWPSIYRDMKKKRGRQPNATMLRILQGSYYRPRVPTSRRPNLEPIS